jgi:site-specific recombinase XerD
MTIREGVELFKQHKKGNVTKNTLRSYGRFLEQLQARFSEKEVFSVSPDDIGAFLDECTEGLGRSTRHLRYAQIKAFFQLHHRGNRVEHQESLQYGFNVKDIQNRPTPSQTDSGQRDSG